MANRMTFHLYVNDVWQGDFHTLTDAMGYKGVEPMAWDFFPARWPIRECDEWRYENCRIVEG